MKNIIFLFAIMLLSFVAQGQETFVQLVQKDSTYRFQRVEVRQFETLTDTLIVERFPERWLSLSELRAYQEGQLIPALVERADELSRLRRLAINEVNMQIGFYDNLNGAGAWLSRQKAAVLADMGGGWVLTDRNGTTTRDNVVVTGSELKKNNNKKGTLTVMDDLTVTLSGYYNFDLVFERTAAGWKAARGQRVFILKRAG